MRPRVDQGKFAKEQKALRPRDARKLEARERLPPHKKERKYFLTVEWTRSETVRQETAYTTKAAREEARRRLEREIKANGNRLSYWHWGCTRDITNKIDSGPVFSERDECLGNPMIDKKKLDPVPDEVIAAWAQMTRTELLVALRHIVDGAGLLLWHYADYRTLGQLEQASVQHKELRGLAQALLDLQAVHGDVQQFPMERSAPEKMSTVNEWNQGDSK